MDPIADMLAQINNAQRVHKPLVEIKHSKIKEGLAKLFSKQEFVGEVKVFKASGKPYKTISIELLYVDGEPKITKLKRVSKSGSRVYVTKEELTPVKRGLGCSVISTSKGLMSSSEAKSRDLGGEFVCELW